jgi:transcriptional regulator with XRE-family HTH domain
MTPENSWGHFCARRESLDPQRLGLPRSGRRRTPGLRREEVALLADVGVTWYTWLEQGRDVNPSSAVMAAVAKALQCTPTEARHVFVLAGLPPGEARRRCAARASAKALVACSIP